MDTFLNAIVLVCEQFLSPTEAVYDFVERTFPGLSKDMFDAGQNVIAFALILIFVGLISTLVGIIVNGLIEDKTQLAAPLFLPMTVGLVVLGFLDSRIVITPSMLNDLFDISVTLSIFFSFMFVGYSGYYLGHWAVDHIAAMLAAFVIAVGFVLILNEAEVGIRLLVSLFIIFASSGISSAMLTVDMGGVVHPFLAIGIALLVLIGAIFEPVVFRSSVMSVLTDEAMQGRIGGVMLLWYFGRFLFPVSFVIGLGVAIYKFYAD